MNDKTRSTVGTKLPVTERRLSVSPARPAAVSAASLRLQLSECLQTPFAATVLPSRTRRRGATSSGAVSAPSHRPDLLAQRSATRLKPGKPRRIRGRCQRRRRTKAAGRAGSPARADANSTTRGREGRVERRKPRALMHSRHMQGMNTQAREPARDDVRFIRDRVISQSGGISRSDSSPETASVDTVTVVPAAPDVAHSAVCAVKAAAIPANKGRIETHASANNTGAESRRQTSLAATAAAETFCCQSLGAGSEEDHARAEESGCGSLPAPAACACGIHLPLVCSETQTDSEDDCRRHDQPCPVCHEGQKPAPV